MLDYKNLPCVQLMSLFCQSLQTMYDFEIDSTAVYLQKVTQVLKISNLTAHKFLLALLLFHAQVFLSY
jgi:hypothetical protein